MVHFLYDRKFHFLSYKNAPRGCALAQKENVTHATTLGGEEEIGNIIQEKDVF
jgi:hypothetical protein